MGEIQWRPSLVTLKAGLPLARKCVWRGRSSYRTPQQGLFDDAKREEYIIAESGALIPATLWRFCQSRPQVLARDRVSLCYYTPCFAVIRVQQRQQLATEQVEPVEWFRCRPCDRVQHAWGAPRAWASKDGCRSKSACSSTFSST